MRALKHLRKHRLATLAALALGLGLSAVAWAYFATTGSGTASASIGALPAPKITATPSAGAVSLSWTAADMPGAGVTYYVERDGQPAGGDCAVKSGPSSATSCTDTGDSGTGLTAGVYTYTVTAQWHSWTANSTPKTVTLGGQEQIKLTGSTDQLTGGATRTFTATIYDAEGNPVTSGGDAGASITFAQKSGTGSVIGLATVTAVAGVATGTITAAQAGDVSLVASATLQGTATNSNPVTFTVSKSATIVSLEFDDGLTDQLPAAQMLQTRGMKGTFFINSGRIASSGYMSMADVQALAAAGHEVGGHTVTHADLPTLSSDEATRQVCNDRANLLNHGFAVTDFAYPFGDTSPSVEQVAAACGYNSARTIGGIHTPSSCDGCADAERIPPTDVYDTLTPNSLQATQSLSEIEGLVTQAESTGGGWVQLVMHHVCSGTNCDPTYSISPGTLSSLLDWLAQRNGQGTIVRTVADVVGGTVKPAVPGASAALPGTGNLLQNPSLESIGANGMPTCWQLGGYGSNTFTSGVTSDASAGTSAYQITMTSYVDGDRRLLSQEDLGGCAPLAQTGHMYVPSVRYHSTVPVVLATYLRTTSGTWNYWQGWTLPASADWTQSAPHTTSAVPAGHDGIAVAVSLRTPGSFTADDFSLTDADTTSPTVSLTSPLDGATVTGNVPLNASASDASGLRKVDFLVNGEIVGTSTTAPYTMTWDSSAFNSAAITARATDTAGNVTTSAIAHVTVAHPPTVSMQSPVDGAAISGVQTLRADASDTLGVANVEFLVDGTSVGASPSTSSPYTLDWDTSTVSDGSHALKVSVTNTAGLTTSDTHAVTVDNTPPTSTASASAASSASVIHVDYTASDGGSGLSEVDLYASAPNDNGAYTNVQTDLQNTGGFDYAATVDGTYSFYTVAIDKAGVAEAAPPTADATTVYEAPFGTLDHFVVTMPNSSTAGHPVDVTVTAKDAAEKTVTNYVGSVQFSGGGTDAALPAAYAFVPGDNGTHTFSITMTSAGDQTISVADTVQTSVHGQASISVGAAGAAKLVFTTQPADAVAGSAFTTQPVVHALDTYGNLATDYTGSVSLAVTTGTGTLTGCPSANADGGVATFSDCEIDQAGEGHVLTATADGLSSADSAPLTVAPGAATKLVFTTQPDGGITGGTAFPKQPVVTVEDAHGNVVTDFGGTVSLAIKAGTGGAGSLSGCVAHLAGGVAKFTGCSVDKVGDGYVLTAAATGLASADSTAFDVGTGSPAAISVATGSGQSATVDTAFADSLVALVTDAGGNLVPGVTVTFTAPASGASGTFRGSDTTTATTGADGKATADVLTANTTAGDYNVTASVASRTATFRETNAPGAPAVVIKGAGDNQVTVIGNAFATALNVTVKDAHGNAVPSARVTFAAPGLGASGSFASTGCSGQPPATTCTVTTATNGTAATSLFTANGTAGGYAITATATGGSNPSASLALTNAPALSYGGNGSPTTWLSGGSKTAAYPSGTSPNDLLLLEVVGKGTTPSSTPPAGWTYLTSTAAGGNTVDLAVFWRLAGAETSVSFTPGDSAGSAWVVRYARGGGYPPNPVSAMTSAQSGTPGGNGSTTLTPTPLAATNAANAVEINLVAQASTATLSLSSQNNFTRQYTGAAGSAAFAVADRTVASPSTPTAPTWSSPTSARWVWSAVAFK